MATSKNALVTRNPEARCIGLLANGASGQWEVAIDETTTGADRWFAQIEGPSISFYFEIPSVAIVARMLQFLQPSLEGKKHSSNHAGQQTGGLVLTKDKKMPLTLIRDDEYEGRFFLVMGQMDSPMVRYTLTGKDATQIADALRQVMEDL
jgi:hypothetical protein